MNPGHRCRPSAVTCSKRRSLILPVALADRDDELQTQSAECLRTNAGQRNTKRKVQATNRGEKVVTNQRPPTYPLLFEEFFVSGLILPMSLGGTIVFASLGGTIIFAFSFISFGHGFGEPAERTPQSVSV